MPLITAITPVSSSYMVLPGKTYYPVRIQATVTEPNLALTTVAAALDWNDGQPPTQYAPGSAPLTVDETRTLALGSYFITLMAWNYLQPVPQRVALYFSVQVQPEQIVTQPQTYLFGPILPTDSGSPNAEQWNFNIGTNLKVLASSVKMLLITTKGERVMQPTYGTLLRRIVFEPNDSAVESVARQEIDEALNQFEPRVSLEALNVARISSREVRLDAKFLSKLDQTSFQLSLPFTQ